MVRDFHMYVSGFGSLAGYDDDAPGLAQQPTTWLHEDGRNRASHI